jgi:predicted RNA-binding protein with TRAM domain
MAEIKQGDLLDIKIEFAGKKGDGVAKMNDYVIFVPNVKEGDDLNVKITKVLDKVAFAEVAKA